MQQILNALNSLLAGMVTGLATDASYRQGFVVGLIAAAILGFVANQLLYFWGLIIQFFSPTRRPATNPGPSPADSFSGCLVSVLTLLVLALGLLVLASLVFPPPPGP